MIAFSKTIAREHARDNIRVNSICPEPGGYSVASGNRDDEFGKKVMGSILNYIPLKRLAKPEDIAPLVVFLASDGASYITGQVISVSGGLTMAG